MILYTPLAPEDIFPAQNMETAASEVISHKGILIQAEALGNGSYRVQQLLSTDPADYLKTDYAPGSIVNL